MAESETRRDPRVQTAALRQQLNEKAAATDQLRETLDELRQVLDVDTATPPPEPRRRRPWLIGIAVLGLLAIAFAVIALDDRGGHQDLSAARSPATGTSAAGGAGGSGSTASSAPAPTRRLPGTGRVEGLRPLPWPGGAVLTPPGLTSTGPGADAPGTDVQTAVDPDGMHVDVFERLRLEHPTSDPLVMVTPSLPALSLEARVTDLQVQLDDRVVPPAPDGTGSWSATPPAGRPYTTATLRYRIANGLVAVTPAAAGRAFGLVTPLTGAISQAHGQPVVVRTLDPKVIGISCPTAAGDGTVCGTKTLKGWRAAVPDGTTPLIVLLQVNVSK